MNKILYVLALFVVVPVWAGGFGRLDVLERGDSALLICNGGPVFMKGTFSVLLLEGMGI